MGGGEYFCTYNNSRNGFKRLIFRTYKIKKWLFYVRTKLGFGIYVRTINGVFWQILIFVRTIIREVFGDFMRQIDDFWAIFVNYR